MILNSIMPRVSLVAAIDTNGQVWFTLSHSTTDSDFMAMFFKHLASKLDEEQPGWQDDTVFLLDNASYHWSSDTQNALRIMGLQVIYSGPYSFSAAPAETLFS